MGGSTPPSRGARPLARDRQGRHEREAGDLGHRHDGDGDGRQGRRSSRCRASAWASADYHYGNNVSLVSGRPLQGRRQGQRPAGDLHLQGAVVTARAALLIGLAALALPAQAAAHGRAATIALDYRLVLDPAARTLPGVHVRVLDGDRAFEVRVDPGVRVVVRGRSARAVPADRLDRGVGERELADRDRRRGRPGRRDGAGCGSAAATRSPGTTTGSRRRRRAGPARPGGSRSRSTSTGGPGSICGHLLPRCPARRSGPGSRVRPDSSSPIVVAVRRRPWRAALTIGLGVAAGVAALAAVTTFAVRDAPTGGVVWLQIGGGIAVALVLAVLLVRLRGRAAGARRRRGRRDRRRRQPQLAVGLLARRRHLGASLERWRGPPAGSRSWAASARRCSASCRTSTSRRGGCAGDRAPARGGAARSTRR